MYTNTHPKSVIACPDSGSDDNIMSRKLADQFGLTILDIQSPASSAFVLANGRTVSAVGQVHVKCAFRKEFPDTSIMHCVFYVFQTLAVPMIMGIEFLQATETLTKHRDRLVEELVPSFRALRVCSVGRPKRDVVCRVGNYVGCATADTGSDLDLVSPDFAASRAFDVEDSCVELEFADGSTGYTAGLIKAAFSIGRVSDVEGFIPKSKEMSLELFILENLNADILVGLDTIQDLQAFSIHEDSFIPAMPRLGESDLNIIRYIGAVEGGLSRTWELLKNSFTSSEKRQAAANSKSLTVLFANQTPLTRLTMYQDRDHKRKRLQQHDQVLHDQLDNRSRPPATETVPRSSLIENGKNLIVHHASEAGSDELASTPSTSTSTDRGAFSTPITIDQYQCSFKGCGVPPLQTEWLLKAHENVHTLARPFYCPVKDCPHHEGGRGFKWVNDMIQHWLGHGSPGYTCPYCPDRKGKFPRSDLLYL